MRSQVLAGILGVAGPNPPLGWLSTVTALSFVAMTNDRPNVAAQPTLPITVPVRSDFVGPLRSAIQSLHDQGCQVPFLGGPSTLPMSAVNASPPADPLPYLGRVLVLASATALVNPASDVLVLARTQGSADAFQIAARASGTGSATVVAANYDAIQCSATSCATIALPGAKLVYLSPILATAGFYPAAPLPMPASGTDTAWSRLTNITGLVAGTTKLGDELALLYSWSDIANSVFASILGWVWNGTKFAMPA
jgi:hypothetical protein